ncbi:Usp domain-containing protein [Hyphomicrobiales bacterium]|nr:Usp domain-containing protein [Hyphomicrobiales bacterium]CAH1699856.1 Usp domain-containing protein [Hyphomicrobiales bacterium]CAI0343585.1 Usp domain-containing protein [Hyphomicrobiales bacterium]
MAHEFKSILVGLVPSDAGAGAATPGVHFSIGLARRFGASLTFHAFVPRASTPYSAVGGFAAGIVATENKRRHELAQAAVDAAKHAADAAGLACVMDLPDLAFEQLSARFNHQSRLHDVTILDAGDDLLGDNRHAIEEALFNSGRPVIVVPKAGGSPEPQRIAIAWDGSARSARAVNDALPLLQSAQTVSVIVIAGEKDLSEVAQGIDLLGYLERHGIEGEVVNLVAKHGDVAETLRRHVRESATELVVMGAFVHSRFRQAILGGVTRSLLESSPVPLFMAY